MNTRWMVAFSVLSVAAMLGTGFAYVAANDNNVSSTSTTELKPLLTVEQIADLRAMMDDLRANSTDRNETMQLVEAQVGVYIAENLEAYNLTQEQITEVLNMFKEIRDKTAEIKDVAFQLREQNATFNQARETLSPMMQELRSLRDQLSQTLQGFGISHGSPQPPHHPGRPEGPRPLMQQCNGSPNPNRTCNCSSPQALG
jgi:uncharacterized phage infection (PIP) family protein YhgE